MRLAWPIILLASLLQACGGGGGGGGPAPATLSLAQVGDLVFQDTVLSASGKLACSTCHDPDHFHGPANADPVQPGGVTGTAMGLRSVPSIRYASFIPRFSHEFINGQDVWAGGLNRDGRARTLEEQALGVLFSEREMANASNEALIARISKASWYPALFKAASLNDKSTPAAIVEGVTIALGEYMRNDPKFAPFDSKFDQVQAGKASFTAAEARGLALFNSPEKGNCAFCHPSTPVAGLPVLFTDFGYDNLGVPRNTAIADNGSASFFDMGVCGPVRTDAFTADTTFCGKFKAPTLRNVAMRPVFFHNGSFTDLRQVVKFYVTRDTNPELWYPKDGTGTVLKFNDTPAIYQANVNLSDVPYDRKPGDAPRLNDAEIDDVVSFLRTLTDGYKPALAFSGSSVR